MSREPPGPLFGWSWFPRWHHLGGQKSIHIEFLRGLSGPLMPKAFWDASWTPPGALLESSYPPRWLQVGHHHVAKMPLNTLPKSINKRIVFKRLLKVMLAEFEKVVCVLLTSKIEPNRDQVRKAAFIKNVIFLEGKPLSGWLWGSQKRCKYNQKIIQKVRSTWEGIWAPIFIDFVSIWEASWLPKMQPNCSTFSKVSCKYRNCAK